MPKPRKFKSLISKQEKRKKDKQIIQKLQHKERQQISSQFKNPDLRENLTLSYSDFCLKYQLINGKPPKPYFINGYRTPNITKDGFEIHHIGENQIPNLNNPVWAFLEHLQTEDMLVYLTPVQHTIAHLLIVFENPNTKLGQGGLFNFGMFKKTLHELDSKDRELLICLTEKYIPNIRINIQQQAFKPYVERTLPQIVDEREILLNNTVDGRDTYFTPEQWKNMGLRDYYANRAYTRIVRRYNDIMLIYSFGRDGYLLWNGTQGNNKTYDNIPDGVQFNEIINAYRWFCEQIDKILEPIAETIKQYGGTGNKHGLIVDVDDYNKIAVDFENKILNPYYAGSKFEHTPYCSCAHLLTTNQTELLTTSRRNDIPNDQKFAIQLAVQASMIPGIPGGKLELTNEQQKLVASHNYLKDMYNRNDKILRIQASVETNTIKTLEWDVVEMYRNFCLQNTGAVLTM